MSLALRLLSYQDLATVTQVDVYTATGVPPSLVLTGKSFVGAAAVLINGEVAPEFIVTSSSRLIAQIPRSQVGKVVSDVAVLLSSEGETDTAVLNLSLSNRFPISGTGKLVQDFLRILLTTPGTDVFNPGAGGGLQRIVGSTYQEQRAALLRSIQAAKNTLIRMQAQNARLSASEKLKDVELTSSSFDPGSLTVRASIRITAIDGSSSTPSVLVG